MKKYLLSTILFVLLAACSTPSKLAKKCADLFPVTDTVVIKERTIPDTLIIPDYYVEYLDTTICPPSPEPTVRIDTVAVKVRGKSYPVEVVVHDTFTIRTDQAAVQVLKDKLQVAEKHREDLIKRLSKSWPKSLVITMLVVGLVLGLGVSFGARRLTRLLPKK